MVLSYYAPPHNKKQQVASREGGDTGGVGSLLCF